MLLQLNWSAFSLNSYLDVVIGNVISIDSSSFFHAHRHRAHARVHRRHEHDGRGLIDQVEGAGDGDVALFQQLPHDLGHVAPEFWQFVKEQDAVTAPIGLEDDQANQNRPPFE